MTASFLCPAHGAHVAPPSSYAVSSRWRLVNGGTERLDTTCLLMLRAAVRRCKRGLAVARWATSHGRTAGAHGRCKTERNGPMHARRSHAVACASTRRGAARDRPRSLLLAALALRRDLRLGSGRGRGSGSALRRGFVVLLGLAHGGGGDGGDGEQRACASSGGGGRSKASAAALRSRQGPRAGPPRPRSGF